MTLWDKLLHRPELLHQAKVMYANQYPIEVRHHLAAWIEDNIRTDVQLDNPRSREYVENVISNLVTEIERKAECMTSNDMFSDRLKLTETANMFREQYRNNALALFKIISDCLITEKTLLSPAEIKEHGSMDTSINENFPTASPTPDVQIRHQVECLRQQTQMTGSYIHNFVLELETLEIGHFEYANITEVLSQLESRPEQTPEHNTTLRKLHERKKMRHEILNQQYTGMLQKLKRLLQTFEGILNEIKTLLAIVVDDKLKQWARNQKLAGNGAPFVNNIDTIQEWCELLADIICQNHQQIRQLGQLKQKIRNIPGEEDVLLSNLLLGITNLLGHLVKRTFIVEIQPPQVLRTKVNFTATVRHLVGGQLNVHMLSPHQVKVSIINEAQALAIHKSGQIPERIMSCGPILNNTVPMEYNYTKRQLSAQFRSMRLEKIDRSAEKKGQDSVRDEKSALLFQSEFRIGGDSPMYKVHAVSVPVVVVVHVSQEARAWGTITWDNAFSLADSIPFHVPEEVTWAQIAEVLSMKFKAETGRGLSDENLCFLAEKALNRSIRGEDYGNLTISLSQFCKEKLPGSLQIQRNKPNKENKGFTFFEWFYGVMKIIQDNMCGPWKDGYIMGFVSKEHAEKLLSACPTGTFLLRFSDSAEQGGVTIAWKKEDGKVYMVQPCLHKDLAIRKLADRIADQQNDLKFVYPNTPRDVAFGKYYSPPENQQPNSDGYVTAKLVTQVSIPASPSTSVPPTPTQLSYGDFPFVASSTVNSYQDSMNEETSKLIYEIDDMTFNDIDFSNSFTADKLY